MSFAVIQMVSQSDVLANLAQARRLLEQAAAGGAKLAASIPLVRILVSGGLLRLSLPYCVWRHMNQE